MFDDFRPFMMIGLIFILIGLLLVALPFLAKTAPSLEKLPPILWYVYRSDGFYFATSPILILISIASLLWFFLSRVAT